MSDDCSTNLKPPSNVDKNHDMDHTDSSERRGLGVRHVQTGLMAVASFVAYSLRSNLSVAIVAMVNHEKKNITTVSTEYPLYKWSEETQGIVLSSFFWGYVITQIPAGILTEKFGGHRFLCGGLFFNALLTLLLPPSAYLGDWKLVCVNRMLQGISQGFVFPSIYTLLGVWAPPDERGRLTSLSLGGQLLGTVVAIPLAGFISSAYGWPSVFYWFGVAGAVIGLTMVFLGADTPSSHMMISEEEKNYIRQSLGGAKKKVAVPVPWKNIVTSVPVWAAICTNALSAAVFLTFLMIIPTYMGTVLKFDLKKNGVLSALPFFVSWLFSFVFSWISDFLTRRGTLQLTSSRKIFNSIATIGAAICMIGMAYSGNPAMSVFLLTAFLGVLAAVYPGVQANFVDLAPNFAGPVFSLSNLFAALLGLTGPIIVGLIVTETGSAEQWRTVFFISAALIFTGNLLFLIWGAADIQPWNWSNYTSAPQDEKEHSQSATDKMEKENHLEEKM